MSWLSFYNFDPNDTWNVEGRVLRPGHCYCSQARQCVRAHCLGTVTRVISQLLTWITLATVTTTNDSNLGRKENNKERLKFITSVKRCLQIYDHMIIDILNSTLTHGTF